MFEKKIHLIWLGDRKFEGKYLEKLKEIYFDYEIKIWGNKDFDFNENEFTKIAYKEKNWSFLSDYFRIKVLYEFGGIYLDTDMNPIKTVSPILEQYSDSNLILSFEYNNSISMGFVAAKKNHPFFKKLFFYYNNIPYVNYFRIGNLIWTEILFFLYPQLDKKNSFQKIDDVIMFSREHFSNLVIVKEKTFFLHRHELNWIKTPFLRKIVLFFVGWSIIVPSWIHEILLRWQKKKEGSKKININPIEIDNKEFLFKLGIDSNIKSEIINLDRKKNWNVTVTSNGFYSNKFIKGKLMPVPFVSKIKFKKTISLEDDITKIKKENPTIIFGSADFLNEVDFDEFKKQNNCNYLIFLILGEKEIKKKYNQKTVVENFESRLNILLHNNSIDLVMFSENANHTKKIFNVFENNRKYYLNNDIFIEEK